MSILETVGLIILIVFLLINILWAFTYLRVAIKLFSFEPIKLIIGVWFFYAAALTGFISLLYLMFADLNDNFYLTLTLFGVSSCIAYFLIDAIIIINDDIFAETQDYLAAKKQ